MLINPGYILPTLQVTDRQNVGWAWQDLSNVTDNLLVHRRNNNVMLMIGWCGVPQAIY